MPDSTLETNGWNQWAKYVLKTLEELSQYNKDTAIKVDQNKDAYIEALNAFKLEVTAQFGDLKKEISVIKTKTAIRSSLIGAIAAGIPAAAYLIYYIISHSIV